jgi:hypothetical protein
MIVAVFRRRLREGVTFEQFVEAWEADRGYGVPARVFNSVSLENPRDVLTIGFVGVEAADFLAAMPELTAHDRGRHDRIDDVIESTELRGMYDLRTEHDFTNEPRAVDGASAESLLAALRGL